MKLDLRLLVRYNVVFKSKWASYSTVFAGLSFFLLTVCYFGIKNLTDCGFGEIVFSMILPMLLMVVFVVLLRGVHFPGTPVYGILGALYCLSMIIHTFSYDNFLYGIFGMLWYVITGLICLATTGGYIANRAYMSITFLLPAIYRLVFIDLWQYIFKLDILGFIPEAAVLSGLVVFGLFALGMEPKPIRKTQRRRVKTE